MGDILRKAVASRRKRIIDILLLSGAFKEVDEHLLGLSLTELENEYKRLKQTCHPHHNVDALKWKSKYDRSDS